MTNIEIAIAVICLIIGLLFGIFLSNREIQAMQKERSKLLEKHKNDWLNLHSQFVNLVKRYESLTSAFSSSSDEMHKFRLTYDKVCEENIKLKEEKKFLIP